MNFITTECPGCGEAEIPLDSVTLRICEDDDSARCVVHCVHCGARFTKPVDDGMSLLLVTFGIEVETWQRPAEVDERPLHHPPISFAELEAFSEMLQNGDVMPLLLEGTPDATN